MNEVITKALYIYYLRAGVPYEGWVDLGNGRLAWAHLEANIVHVPYNKSGGRFLKVINTPVCVTIDVLEEEKHPNAPLKVNSENNTGTYSFNDLLEHIRFFVLSRRWNISKSDFDYSIQQVPFSKLSSEQQDIIRTFANSPNSKEFLSDYVNGGQNIGGVKLRGNTKLNQFLDIIFDYGDSYVSSGSSFIRTGQTSVKFENDSFTMQIKIDQSISKEAMAIIIGHEAFLHAEKMTKIILEKLNNSLPQEQKENLRKLFPPEHQEHLDFSLNKGENAMRYTRYLDYLKAKYDNSNAITKAISDEIKENKEMVEHGQ